jgi:hypothetical protein
MVVLTLETGMVFFLIKASSTDGIFLLLIGWMVMRTGAAAAAFGFF